MVDVVHVPYPDPIQNRTGEIDARSQKWSTRFQPHSVATIRLRHFEDCNAGACGALSDLLSEQSGVRLVIEDGDVCHEGWAILRRWAVHLRGLTAEDASVYDVRVGGVIADASMLAELALWPDNEEVVDAVRNALAERTRRGFASVANLRLTVNPALPGWAALLRVAGADSIEIMAMATEWRRSDDPPWFGTPCQKLTVRGPGGLMFLWRSCLRGVDHPTIEWWLGSDDVAGFNGSTVESNHGDPDPREMLWKWITTKPGKTDAVLIVRMFPETAAAATAMLAVLRIADQACERVMWKCRVFVDVSDPTLHTEEWYSFRNVSVTVRAPDTVVMCQLSTEIAVYGFDGVSPRRTLQLRCFYRPREQIPAAEVDRKLAAVLAVSAGALRHVVTTDDLLTHAWETLTAAPLPELRSFTQSSRMFMSGPGIERLIRAAPRIDSIRLSVRDGAAVTAVRDGMRAWYNRVRPFRVLHLTVAGFEMDDCPWNRFFDHTPRIDRIRLSFWCHPDWQAPDEGIPLGRLRCGERLELDGPMAVPFASAATLDRPDGPPRPPLLCLRIDQHDHHGVPPTPAGIAAQLEREFRGCERIPRLSPRVRLDVFLPGPRPNHRLLAPYSDAIVAILNRIHAAALKCGTAFSVRFNPTDPMPAVDAADRLTAAMEQRGARFPFSAYAETQRSKRRQRDDRYH